MQNDSNEAPNRKNDMTGKKIDHGETQNDSSLFQSGGLRPYVRGAADLLRACGQGSAAS